MAAVIAVAVRVSFVAKVIPALGQRGYNSITTTQAVSGTYQLFGVACPKATTCEAVGVGPNNGSDEGVVVTIT